MEGIINNFYNKKIGVMGDIMLDHYIRGVMERISPEAPTPVISFSEESFVLGGAGNTAANIKALGGEPIVVGEVGDDVFGRIVKKEVHKISASKTCLLINLKKPTVVKMRITVSGQQVTRLDREDTRPVNRSTETAACAFLEKEMPHWSGLVVSDYAKGFITKTIARCAVRAARRHRVPIIVDTKPNHFLFFKNATLLKPNKKEAEIFYGKMCNTQKDIERAGAVLREKVRAAVLLTRGAEGMSLFEKNDCVHFKSHAREVYDVTGAGDTVVAALVLALAGGATLPAAAEIANAAAGIVVGKRGTSVVSRDELRDYFSNE